MSKFLISVEEHRTYEADAEALKTQYPDEYGVFLRDIGTTDKEWVEDCWDNGSPKMFRLLGAEVDVEISIRRADVSRETTSRAAPNPDQ